MGSVARQGGQVGKVEAVVPNVFCHTESKVVLKVTISASCEDTVKTKQLAILPLDRKIGG